MHNTVDSLPDHLMDDLWDGWVMFFFRDCFAKPLFDDFDSDCFEKALFDDDWFDM